MPSLLVNVSKPAKLHINTKGRTYSTKARWEPEKKVFPFVDGLHRHTLLEFQCHRCTSKALEGVRNQAIEVFHTNSQYRMHNSQYSFIHSNTVIIPRTYHNAGKLSACANSGCQARFSLFNAPGYKVMVQISQNAAGSHCRSKMSDNSI